MGFDPIKEISDWWSRLSGNGKNSSAYDDFVKRMQDLLDKPYDNNVTPSPDLPNYDKMNTDDRTDEQLKELAQAKLKEYEQMMKNQIDSQSKQANDILSQNKHTAEQKQKENQEAINNGYDDAQNNLNNDISKRGLARSSIAVNKTAQLQGDKQKALDSNNQRYGEILLDLEKQISGLEEKRQKALDDFDIAYAAKLTQEISALTNQRDKTNTDALKYNNNLLTQEQKDYATYLSNQQKELAANDAANKKELLDRQTQFFNEAKQILGGMSAKEARQKLENDPIFLSLPAYMHTQLYKQFAM